MGSRNRTSAGIPEPDYLSGDPVQDNYPDVLLNDRDIIATAEIKGRNIVTHTIHAIHDEVREHYEDLANGEYSEFPDEDRRNLLLSMEF